MNKTQELENIVSEEVRKRKSLKSLPKDLLKNVMIGPILYEGLKNNDECVLEPPLFTYWAIGQATGYAALAASISCGFDFASASPLEIAIFVPFIISTYCLVANVWGPIFGAADRAYGLYKTVKDYVIGSKEIYKGK